MPKVGGAGAITYEFFARKNHHSITFPLFIGAERVMDGVMDGDSGDGFCMKKG